jgi:hypothetical protein
VRSYRRSYASRRRRDLYWEGWADPMFGARIVELIRAFGLGRGCDVRSRRVIGAAHTWIKAASTARCERIPGRACNSSFLAHQAPAEESFPIVIVDRAFENCVFPCSDGRGAAAIAERLRATVANTPFLMAGADVAITVSIGVARLEAEERNVEALFDQAERQLYRSKLAGCDRVSAPSARTRDQRAANKPCDRRVSTMSAAAACAPFSVAICRPISAARSA